MARKQLPLDFPRETRRERGEELAILREAVLPSVKTKRGGVSGSTLKAVLRAIDDHGRVCFAKQETLAREVGISKEQCKRAVDALENHLSLICKERMETNHYRIVWEELRLLNQSREPAKCHGDTSESVMVTPQSVTGDTSINRPEAQQEPSSPSAPSVNWEAAEAEVLRELTDWKTPVAIAKGRVSPQYVVDVVAYYRASAGDFGPGALYRRLMRSHPELPPFEGWPQPKPLAPSCQRAIELLADARNHPNAQQMHETEFRKRFLAVLTRNGLAQYFEEALLREGRTKQRGGVPAAY